MVKLHYILCNITDVPILIFFNEKIASMLHYAMYRYSKMVKCAQFHNYQNALRDEYIIQQHDLYEN